MLYLTMMSIYELFMADLAVTCYLRFDELKKLSYKKHTTFREGFGRKKIFQKKIKKKHFSKFTSKIMNGLFKNTLRSILI